MRTNSISSLISSACAVDIFLKTADVATRFLNDAEKEGFIIEERIQPHDGMWVCLHEDKTISYPPYSTFGGAMKFHNDQRRDGKIVIKIDYEKFRESDPDFIKNLKAQ